MNNQTYTFLTQGKRQHVPLHSYHGKIIRKSTFGLVMTNFSFEKEEINVPIYGTVIILSKTKGAFTLSKVSWGTPWFLAVCTGVGKVLFVLGPNTVSCPFFVKKVALEHSHAHVYILPMAAFSLQKQN